MNISIDNALGIHPAALQLRTVRTTVLGNNIAHADTPGYQARDIDFAAELKKRTGVANTGSLTRTDPRHAAALGNVSSASNEAPSLLYRTPLLPSLDRNTVNVHAEQAAFARNNVEMQASLQFLTGRIRGTLSAIRGE